MLLLSGLAAAGIAAIISIVAVRGRKSPQERERLRRLAIHRHGRVGDATIQEAGDGIVYYSYSIRGVEYTASQDISALKDRIDDDPETLIGPVGLKFMPKDPFNSIVLCEEWSGIRKRESALLQKGA
ncbi:MAG: hypothetical protein ABJF23_16145 [Bryobacteraceae bacterium]